MEEWRKSSRWMTLLFLGLFCVTACSAQRNDPHGDIMADTSDPFDDPFFTDPPVWDDSVLQQSEVLTQDAEEPEKPRSWRERGEGVIFSTLRVGASLGTLALPFLGF